MKIENCKICKKLGVNYLYQQFVSKSLFFFKYNFHQSIPLCLEHLLQGFSSSFINYVSKMVVFSPVIREPGKSHLSYSYEFIPLSKCSREIHWSPLTICQEGLKLIHGACQKCERSAQVAFFTREGTEWLGEIPVPNMHKEKPEILCAVCAMQSIERDLKTYAKDFTEGIYAPYGGNGIFITKDY